MGGALDSAGGFLGLNEGPKANVSLSNNALSDLIERQKVNSSAPMSEAINKYGTGQMSLMDALNANQGSNGLATSEMRNMLATDPLSGSMFATNQVQNNPILGQLFGQNGTLGRTAQEEQKLSSQGFQLQPEDIEAYGQASGNIARMFGQQEQGLSQSLADRGLASAPNGAAGAGFSGLMGNKNEQLARAQMDIANQRMQNTMQRLGQTRQFMSQLGAQGADAINQQYGRQQSGVQGARQNLLNTAGIQNQSNSIANQSNLAAQEFEQANKPKNFMDFATAGMGQGLQSALGGSSAQSGQIGDKKYSTGGSGTAGMMSGGSFFGA